MSRTTVAIRSLLLITSAVMLVSGCDGDNAARGTNGGGPAVVGFVTALPSTTATASSPTDAVTATTTVSVSTTTSTTPSPGAPEAIAVTTAPPAQEQPKPPTQEQPPAAPPAPTEGEAQEAKVVELTNQQRAAAGCPALVTDDRLVDSARGHSADMAAQDYFDHKSEDGRSFVDRIKAAGYPKPGAENIAAGQSTPEAVMDGWMKSPGHKANILNCGLKTIGVGVAKGGSYRVYWTQNFGW